jgi:hypothetical protein
MDYPFCHLKKKIIIINLQFPPEVNCSIGFGSGVSLNFMRKDGILCENPGAVILLFFSSIYLLAIYEIWINDFLCYCLPFSCYANP